MEVEAGRAGAGAVPADRGAAPVDEDTPVLDELNEQLDRFRLLRKSDEASTDALFEQLGAQSAVDRDIVLELSATRVLGHPERFPEAHALAMRALEVLDRNGARAVGTPKRLGPFAPVAKPFIQIVCRFIVRQHQGELVDAIRNLYDRRLAWSPAEDPIRYVLLRASRDMHRVTVTYKRNPLGLPTFLVGGAAVSAIGSGLRGLAGSAFGSTVGAGIAAGILFVLFGGVAWVILRGAAVARRRIKLTVTRPMVALWETIGRCGNPPKDQARAFALYGIVLTAASWIIVPAGILLVLSRV